MSLMAGCHVFDSADKDYDVFNEDISGAWTSTDDGAQLTLFPTGYFKLELPISPDRVVRGRYEITDGIITFDGSPDNYRRFDFDGTFTLSTEGEQLSFEPVTLADEEQYRLPGPWVKADPLQ